MITVLKTFIYKRVEYKEGRKIQVSPFTSVEESILESQGSIKVTQPKSTKKNKTVEKDDKD